MPLLTLAQQTDLVNRKLAISKQNGNLITFKYHRRVMYDYLWKQYPELLECRGHTYDVTTGELVLAAPTKTFNYLEDERIDSNGVKTGGYWSDVPLDTRVDIYKKFNGFLANVSIHRGEVIVGTTGTTNSDYARMAREMIFNRYTEERVKTFIPNLTYLFEICHPNDPHIVEESFGAKYLGDRSNITGDFFPVAEDEAYYEITLQQALDIVAECKHEGFMVYDAQGNCCKLKSPYYVGKKKLMRMKKDSVIKMFDRPKNKIDGMPEEWYPIISEIVRIFTVDQWLDLTDQQRRGVIERIQFLKDNRGSVFVHAIN